MNQIRNHITEICSPNLAFRYENNLRENMIRVGLENDFEFQKFQIFDSSKLSCVTRYQKIPLAH